MKIHTVDYVSQSIIYLSQQKEALGKTFHLNNPQPIHLSRMVEKICSFGYSIQQVNYEKWLNILKDNRGACLNHLYPLLPFFLKKWHEEKLSIFDVYQQAKRPHISCQDTLSSFFKSR